MSEQSMQHQHEELVILDLVDDAVVAGAHSPLAGSADEWGHCRRSWIGAEQLERRRDTATDWRVALTQLAGRSRRQRDAIGHAKPRLALTCSQGPVSRPLSASRREPLPRPGYRPCPLPAG